MDEYNIPALAEIPATANLAEAVFRRAAEQPQAVVMRRPGPEGLSGPWTDVTAGQFRDEVTALAKGLIAAGIETGDRVAVMSHTRYEWTLIDYADLGRGRGHRAGLRDLLGRAGRVDPRRLGCAGLLRGDRRLRSRSSTASGSGSRRWSTSGGSSRPPPGTRRRRRRWPRLTEAGAGIEDEALTARAEAATASGLATIIYTSGTTGRPKGCELTHQNLLAAVRNAFLGPLAHFTEARGRRHAAVPAARARLRPDHRGGLHRRRGGARALRGHQRAAARAGRLPAHVHPGRAAGVREGVQRRRAEGGQRAQGSDLRPGGPGGDRLQRGAGLRRRPRAGPAGPARGVRPAGLRQAAGGARRPGGVRHLRGRRAHRRGCAISSAARASPCCRATG